MNTNVRAIARTSNNIARVNPFDWSIEAWSAIGSASTALAFTVSAWVLMLQLKDRRRIDAESVTVWVRDEYTPQPEGTLKRKVELHVSNAGARPVFDVQVVIGYGFVAKDTVRLGPLAVPPIPALAPGLHEAWPIDHVLESVPDANVPLRAEVTYRDAAGRWWTRGFVGDVKRWRDGGVQSALRPSTDDSYALEQVGPLHMGNPVAVALAFHAALDDLDEPEGLSQIQALCVPETLEDWGDFSNIPPLLENNGVATFPSYPAPGIAYVKFPETTDALMVASGPTVVSAQIMTLQLRPELDPPGWRVFSIGSPVPPDRVPPAPAS